MNDRLTRPLRIAAFLLACAPLGLITAPLGLITAPLGLVCAPLALVCEVGGPSLARAEHRVALLIDNGRNTDAELALPQRDLQPLADALARYGFRSQIVRDLPDDQLQRTIAAFAAVTPVRGTALVYFRGPALPGTDKGKSGLCLLGVQSRAGRGVLIDTVIDSLHTTGGSERNLVLVDSGQDKLPQLDLPRHFLLAHADGEELRSAFRGGDLLAALRQSADSVQLTLDSSASISGTGSRAVSPPDRFVEGRQAGDEWVDPRGAVFCWCPAGSYTAGSPANEPHRYADETQREVAIEHGFWISKYELTLHENARNRPHRTIARHKNDPLTMINHDDARQMTQRTFTELARREAGLPQDWMYNLSSEAQWEYAARAGTPTRFYFGDDLNQLPRHANFADRSYYDSRDVYSNYAHRTLDDGAVKLIPVGSYLPNPWGLHDVYGNVAEWCVNTAVRGGSWASVPENCRSAYHDSFASRNEQNFIGYRVVIARVPPEKPGP